MGSLDFEATFDKKKVEKALKNVAKQYKDTKPVMKKVAALEVRKAKYRVTTSKKAPSGSRWRAWSYETIKQRAREGNIGRGLLYRTGALLRRFTSKVTKNKVILGNSARYADYLQNGTRNMPARPFLGWDKTSTKDLTKRFELWIKRGWK